MHAKNARSGSARTEIELKRSPRGRRARGEEAKRPPRPWWTRGPPSRRPCGLGRLVDLVPEADLGLPAARNVERRQRVRVPVLGRVERIEVEDPAIVRGVPP